MCLVHIKGIISVLMQSMNIILLDNAACATYLFVAGIFFIFFSGSTNPNGPVTQRKAEDRRATDSNPLQS